MLTIEHANGDGAQHRRELFGSRYNSSKFYHWLRSRGFPDDLGLAVLCGGCNQSSHQNGGVCPHDDPDPERMTSLDPDVIRTRVAWLERQLERQYSLLLPFAQGARTTQS